MLLPNIKTHTIHLSTTENRHGVTTTESRRRILKVTRTFTSIPSACHVYIRIYSTIIHDNKYQIYTALVKS